MDGIATSARHSSDAQAPAGIAAPALFSPPHRAIDSFLDPGQAEAMRGHVDAHFADPHAHSPDSHQVWNYWHVPGLYTYLRTRPEKIMPQALVRDFHAALSAWAADTLGLGYVTWPCLSLYVDGCVQHLHNDAVNGRFGYVFSLTRDDRRSRGGETIVLKEGDLFRDNLTRAGAGSGLQDLIEPRFNRLVMFDDRMPHGVQRVEGTMDPLDGRVVLHGHISEGEAFVRGPLPREALWETLRPVLEPLIAAAEGCHGPLSVRLAIAPDGAVGRVEVLLHRVAMADGGDAGAPIEAIVRALHDVRFPAADGPSQATLPILFGAPLPWMKRESGTVTSARTASAGLVTTRVAPPQAEPAKPAPRGNEARAAVGEAVRARLAATPGVARIPKDRLEAYVVPHFLSEEECEGLIRLIDADRQPSGLLAPTADPEFRTSESCNLNPSEPLVGGLERRIDALLGLQPQFGETVQGQRYAVGQQFKPHHDFFHTSQPYWKVEEPRGGQRTWTVMAFLNKPEAGGQTAFPKAGLKITPAPAHLLIWNNLDVDGEPNDFSLHQGMPVEAGLKYVLTKWYRERPWGGFTGAGLNYLQP